MRLYTKEESVKRMNKLGALHRPFIFVINYNQDASYIEEPDTVDSAELLFDFNGYSNATEAVFCGTDEGEQTTREEKSKRDSLQAAKNPEEKGGTSCIIVSPVFWQPYPQPFDSYHFSFQIVRDHILAGNSFLTNLTCETLVETNLTLKAIYERSHAMYKLWVKDAFTVFSPEIFVRIHSGMIYSYPMKGTIDASLPNAVQCLMEDEKEAAEHATIVDLIRNDLSMIADRVHVSRYRYVDTLHTNRGDILQTSSEIQGVLPDDFYPQLGSLLFRLLPAGSITGAPKKKTMEIIREAETYQRGFYTGIMGYFDGENLDSAVMIRFVEQRDNHLFFKSGGGITFQSDAVSEYNEMKQKVYVPIY
ncbi:para-aminobenzoate synthase component I [gut metagenome]|uniref:Para-aminobenzoate synthase component I n=1 Tax=gut metagenome TaxID=749906 RepID=J9GF52_9ZZZZ